MTNLKLEAIKRENHVSLESARKEANTGTAAARREELLPRTCWKIQKSK